mgnify:CR=1 FL=1
MTDLQPRKIPILTGVNDIPSLEGQPNHPNDSLLCANYNALIDDVETELINVKDDIQTINNNLSAPSNLSQQESPIMIPSFSTNFQGYGYDYEVYSAIYNNLSGFIFESLTFEKPLTATWTDFEFLGEIYNINTIDGVNQSVGQENNVNFTLTLFGDNFEYIEIQYNISGLFGVTGGAEFTIFPVPFSISINLDGSIVTRRIVMHYLNQVRLQNPQLDASAGTGGGS